MEKLQSNAVVTSREAARFGKRPPLGDFQRSDAVQVAQRRCAIPRRKNVPSSNNDEQLLFVEAVRLMDEKVETGPTCVVEHGALLYRAGQP